MVKCSGMEEDFSRDTIQQRAYRAFEALIAEEDATIDVAQAALLIANIAYPDLDKAHYLAQLDALAHRVCAILGLSGLQEPQGLQEPGASHRLPQGIEPLTVLGAMNQVLFEQEHFHGNEGDYYNPGNSFLNKVLEEHVGIPISLSLLYMEVGKRVGLHIDGIGLPFHFVVRCCLPQGAVYIDPFHEGQLLSKQDCHVLVNRMARRRVRFDAHWLEPIGPKQLLLRMLTNLKHIYLRNDDYEHALATCDYIVLLIPHTASEWRDRGTLHLQLKHYARALHDLKRYLNLAPQSEDRYEIYNHIKAIRQIMAMMN